MTTTKNGHTDLEAEAFAEALEAAKTPGERLALIYAKQSRDEARAQSAIFAGMSRRGENGLAEAQAERHRVVEDARAERAASLHAWSALATTTVELPIVGSPVVRVSVRLRGDVCDGGPHRVATLEFVDTEEADRLLMEDCWRPWLDQKRDAEARADHADLAKLIKHVEGKTHAGGFTHRRWLSITKAILLRLIRPAGTLEDLQSLGYVTLTGPIETSAESARAGAL